MIRQVLNLNHQANDNHGMSTDSSRVLPPPMIVYQEDDYNDGTTGPLNTAESNKLLLGGRTSS